MNTYSLAAGVLNAHTFKTIDPNTGHTRVPGKTKVISIAIYEHVETLDYAQAHQLSAILLIFSFAVLMVVYTLNRRFPIHVG